jgi:hypothetical protein
VCACTLVPIRQHGVITQAITTGIFTSTKTSNPTYYIVLATFSRHLLVFYKCLSLLQSCRLLQLNVTEAEPAFWYLHRAMCADIMMNGDDKNKEVMTGIGDRDFKCGDT